MKTETLYIETVSGQAGLVLHIGTGQSVTLQGWDSRRATNLNHVTLLSENSTVELTSLGVPRGGGTGNDNLKVSPNKYLLGGDAAADILWGSKDNVTITGVTPKPNLKLSKSVSIPVNANLPTSSGAGNDTQECGVGDESSLGNAGNDTLSGGAGKDTLAGNAGSDFFLFDTALTKDSNVESILDFKHGEDKLQLKKSIFAKLNVGTLGAANFRASANGLAGDNDDFILYNTKTGVLLYDKDGSGKSAAIQFATLSDKPKNVTASDFLVIS